MQIIFMRFLYHIQIIDYDFIFKYALYRMTLLIVAI